MRHGVEFHACLATDGTIEQLGRVKHKHYVSPAITAAAQEQLAAYK